MADAQDNEKPGTFGWKVPGLPLQEQRGSAETGEKPHFFGFRFMPILFLDSVSVGSSPASCD